MPGLFRGVRLDTAQLPIVKPLCVKYAKRCIFTVEALSLSQTLKPRFQNLPNVPFDFSQPFHMTATP